jgi:hypothetical protein
MASEILRDLCLELGHGKSETYIDREHSRHFAAAQIGFVVLNSTLDL